MKGRGLTPGKVTGIKGHKQKKATGKGRSLQGASMWSQLHPKERERASAELGASRGICMFHTKSQVFLFHSLSRRDFLLRPEHRKPGTGAIRSFWNPQRVVQEPDKYFKAAAAPKR